MSPIATSFHCYSTVKIKVKMSECCLKGFRWEAQPKGHETKLAGTNCYITGSNPKIAVMIIHDLYGWTFPNTRLLADHYAEEVNSTVYVPDL